MKALLITPESRSIEPVEIGSREDIARLIGFDTIDSDALGNEGDRLYLPPARHFADPAAGRGRVRETAA